MADVDPNEQLFLQRLSRLAQGLKGDPYSPFEPLPTPEEQRAAATQYIELKRAQEARVIREQDFGSHVDHQAHTHLLENERLKLEIAKLQLSMQAEQRRLDLEFERLEVQKADVIVRAIEAASRNPDTGRLIEVAQEMSTRLMNGVQLPSLQIEDKGE